VQRSRKAGTRSIGGRGFRRKRRSLASDPCSGRGSLLDRYEFTPTALLEVAAAALYLSSNSGDPTAGERWIAEIEHTCGLIGEQLRIGRARPELGTGTRSLVHGNYTIFYELAGARANILRVLHHRQDVALAFELPRGDPGFGGS
jgi:plasmid stabilization system protein ParE